MGFGLARGKIFNIWRYKMSDKDLAKMIVEFFDWWELPFNRRKDNYKETLQMLKHTSGVKSIYDYLYNEDECGTTYTTIINELNKRLSRGVK